MPKLLTEVEYHRVITYKTELNMTNVAIAEELGVRRQTVAAILRRNQQTNTPVPQIKGNKRKTKSSTSPQEDADLEDLSRASPFKTPRVLKREPQMFLGYHQKKIEKCSSHGEESCSEDIPHPRSKAQETKLLQTA